MRMIAIAMLALGFTSCATQSIHKYCSNPDTVAEYKDYNECYAEVSARREERRLAFKQAIGAGLQGAGQASMNSAGGTVTPPVQCTAMNFGNMTTLGCN